MTSTVSFTKSWDQGVSLTEQQNQEVTRVFSKIEGLEAYHKVIDTSKKYLSKESTSNRAPGDISFKFYNDTFHISFGNSGFYVFDDLASATEKAVGVLNREEVNHIKEYAKAIFAVAKGEDCHDKEQESPRVTFSTATGSQESTPRSQVGDSSSGCSRRVSSFSQATVEQLTPRDMPYAQVVPLQTTLDKGALAFRNLRSQSTNQEHLLMVVQQTSLSYKLNEECDDDSPTSQKEIDALNYLYDGLDWDLDSTLIHQSKGVKRCGHSHMRSLEDSGYSADNEQEAL